MNSHCEERSDESNLGHSAHDYRHKTTLEIASSLRASQ